MSQTSTTQPPAIKSRIGAILRATSGNFLEQFDFFLFGFYASAIAKAFFPSQNETAALLNTFGVFWLGALMRPVGAIVLGAYLDRIGRRQGLIVTLSIMAIGTLVIAFCPSYATIGIAAPAIVLIGRLLQGFSAGVELGGVSVYLAEISTPGNRGFYTSFQSSSQQVAIFVAAIIGYVLSEAMPAATIAAWGWRIPFFIGCLIIPVIFFLRRTLEETPEFLAMKKHPTVNEIFASAVANWRIVILGMMIAVLTTTTFYFVTVYTPTFGKNVLKLSSQDALLVTLKRLKLDLRQAGIIIAINVIATFAIPGISWQAHLGGLVVGTLVGAAMVYAPAVNRTRWQIGTCVVVFAVLVAVIVGKDLSLGTWVCFHTTSANVSCIPPT